MAGEPWKWAAKLHPRGRRSSGTDTTPFDGISLVELAKKVSMDGLRLPPPAGAPLPLLQMMARCWATKPARRPEFEQLLVALRQLFHELQAESAKLRQQAAEAGAEQGP